jgi:hypothetical protein
MIKTAGGKWFGSGPASTNQDGTASLSIDRIGYDYVSIAVQLGTNAATTAPTVLNLTHSDDNTTFTAISATFTGGSATSTTAGFVISPAPGTVTTIRPHTVFNVDCRALKRYVKCSVTPGATTVLGITAIATRGATAPAGTAATGPVAIING